MRCANKIALGACDWGEDDIILNDYLFKKILLHTHTHEEN